MSDATPGQAERERFAAKMEMLADWFDADDFAKGRAGRTEVQEDLRRWAAAARDLAAQDARPAPGDREVDLALAALAADRNQLREALRRVATGTAGDPSDTARRALEASRDYREQWEGIADARPAPELAKLREQLAASDRIVRDILESLCRRDGLSLDSSVEPGGPARNYDLALRLGIGHVFGLGEPAPEPQPVPELAAAMEPARGRAAPRMRPPVPVSDALPKAAPVGQPAPELAALVRRLWSAAERWDRHADEQGRAAEQALLHDPYPERRIVVRAGHQAKAEVYRAVAAEIPGLIGEPK